MVSVHNNKNLYAQSIAQKLIPILDLLLFLQHSVCGASSNIDVTCIPLSFTLLPLLLYNHCYS